MRFIVANYGSRHAGLLLAHLESIVRSHPTAQITVYWQDMPQRLIGAIQAAFSAVDFVRTEFDFAGDPVSRIASKVLCWARAAEEHAEEAALVFADADTLVRLDVTSFFSKHAAEVIFTHKPDEPTPLNTGVVLARGGTGTTGFFRAWRERTLAVLRSPDLLRQATDPALPYAAPDQMSFFQLLGYERGRTDYTFDHIRAKAVQCARLNETNSRPFSGTGEQICIVHYKAGWQRILLDGRPFSRFRPRAESWDMLTFFLDTFAAALARANASARERFRPRDFGITWPWYWQKGRFSAPLYAAWRVKEATKRVWLIATGRLKDGQ